ncbi:MAG: hypothetical protein AAF502_14065 [Bacteroidota bacterium]
MNEKYTFEFIEEYLAGNLSTEEAQEFESAVESDESLAKSLDSQKAAHQAVNLYTQIKTHENVSEIYSKVKGQGQAKVRRLGSMALAATVVFLVFMGIAYFMLSSQYSGANLVANNLEAYPDRITSMSDAPISALSNAMKAYNQNDFTTAIPLFEGIGTDDQYFTLSRLYLGISQLESGNASDAINTLNDLFQMENDLKEPAQWYLALAQLANGDETTARINLEDISENGGYQSSKATGLLKKLDSGWRNLPGVR